MIKNKPEAAPLVGIIMGSDSDLKYMKPAEDVLDQLGVPTEIGLRSAHRTPDEMKEYGRTALSRGLRVIIAGAGGSAHLPGMVASETRVPVLGVAIESSPDGLNAAYGSMNRMPGGIPLYVMGKNQAGALNAGLGAARILALMDPVLGEAYDQYVENMANEVRAKDARLQEIGTAAYLAEMEARG